MSKSARNYADPMQVIASHGADAMRLFLVDSAVLRGEDPQLVGRLWEAMYAAALPYGGRGLPLTVLGALDVALWDLRAQLLGQPVHRLLGGCRTRVLAYASAGLYGVGKTVDDLADEMRGYAAAGFRAVKMKVGGAPLSVDVDRVRAVRAAVGPAVQLSVDAAYALSAREAIRLARAIEPYDILFFEAPVRLDHPGELRDVRRGTRIPLAGNELLSTRFGFRGLVAARLVDIVQPSVTAVGGITEASRVTDTASAFGLACSYQCSGELELLAGLHLALVHPAAVSVEYHMLHRFLPARLRDGALVLRDGYLEAPTAPGLGLPDRHAVAALLSRTERSGS
jgi:L-alanine-DL-glutamate epimerase-like enolase superfamily enzyme